MSFAPVRPEIRDWLIPSQATPLIKSAQARGAWEDIPWDEEGVVLNVLDLVRNDYINIPLPYAVTLKHFSNPRFVVQAHRLIGEAALDLAEVAFDEFDNPAPWLDWQCLSLFQREGSYDAPDGDPDAMTFFDLCEWMQDRGIWDLPRVEPTTQEDCDYILRITCLDEQFWERVHLDINNPIHQRLAKEGFRRNPCAVDYIWLTKGNSSVASYPPRIEDHTPNVICLLSYLHFYNDGDGDDEDEDED